MDIFCKLGKHRAEPSDRWNDGYYFSRCADCGIDLIRRTARWRAVPKGYRVVWEKRREGEIDWSQWMRQNRAPSSPAEL